MRIRKRYKHLRRYRQIGNILARHGFGYLIDQIGIPGIVSFRERYREKEDIKALSRGARLRHALTDLGPTFVKLGQLMSTRRDLLPRDIVLELEKLQDKVPPGNFGEMKVQLEKELNGSVENIFQSFNKDPLAAASVAQVHEARLKTGEDVVVKIRRPHIVEVFETDLEIVFDLARLAEKRTSWGAQYNLVEIVEELSSFLKKELDFQLEGMNAERFARNFSEDDGVYIPKIYWEYSTDKILTMEYVPAINLSRRKELIEKNHDLKKIANNLSNAVLKQIVEHGYFHGDPHPGNVAVTEEGNIVFMDFGQVGHLSSERQKQFARLIMGMVKGNTKMIVNTIMDMGFIKKGVDLKGLRNEIDRMRDKYYSLPISRISFSQTLSELLNIAFKYDIRIPTELTTLFKSMITLEGVVQELDREFSVATVAEPYAKELLRKQYSPENIVKMIEENTMDYLESLVDIPKHAEELLEDAAQGNFSVKLEHKNLDKLGGFFDRVINRLSFSIILLSFSIVMGSLVIGSALVAVEEPRIFQLPILEIAFGISTIMFLWLIYSIFRTGRL